MKALGKGLVAVVFTGAAVAAFRLHQDRPIVPMVSRVPVVQGDVVQVVSATGTLASARSVAVGSQVSGTVKHLLVDYNSIVKKGQVLAEIDPDKAQTQLEVAEAALAQVKSSLLSDQARGDNDAHELTRMEALVADKQETLEDRDAARLAVAEDGTRVRQDQAAITIAETNVEQAKIAIEHCTITSPIDGVVVARDVDEGQTVVATVVSPTIYELAADLGAMEIVGATDEADVAAVRKGQSARFTVDAYPGMTFNGVVREVRLNPTTVNNVVTYQTIIDFKNPDFRLLPGMTTHFVLEVGRSQDVLKVPVSALRFYPTASAKQAFPETAVPTVAPAAPTVAPGLTARVWKVDGRRLVPVQVTLGRTDGTVVAVSAPDLKTSDEVITAIITPARR